MLEERRCFPVLPALFWKRTDSTSPSRYRAKKKRSDALKKDPCHAVSRAWWSFLPRQPRLCPFLRSAWVCVASRLLAESCHPSSQPLRLTFGISPQDGYSRGSSRTSFFQAVSPCLLPPSWGPRGCSAASPSVPTPSRTETQSEGRGDAIGSGGRQQEMAAWLRHPPQPLQSPDALHGARLFV